MLVAQQQNRRKMPPAALPATPHQVDILARGGRGARRRPPKSSTARLKPSQEAPGVRFHCLQKGEMPSLSRPLRDCANRLAPQPAHLGPDSRCLIGGPMASVPGQRDTVYAVREPICQNRGLSPIRGCVVRDRVARRPWLPPIPLSTPAACVLCEPVPAVRVPRGRR